MEVLSIILKIVLVLASIALTVVVLMQEGKGDGLGAVAGGASDSYVSKNSSHTPEGKKKKVTVILAVVFVVVSVVLNVIG